MIQVINFICVVTVIFILFFIIHKVYNLVDKDVSETFKADTHYQMDVGNQFTDFDGLTESQLPPSYIDKRAITNEYPLYKSDKVFTTNGHGIPNNIETSIYQNEGVSLDGLPDSEKSLFMFAHNKSAPECCPSTYSTSTGCVCTTKAQRNFINQRGNNRTLTDNNEF